MKTESEKTMENILLNQLAGQEGMSRVYEICKIGGHKLLLVPVDELWNSQIESYNKFLSGVITTDKHEADIILEVYRPDFDCLLSRRSETIDNVNARVSEFDTKKIDSIKTDLTSPARALFKVAYEKLNLMPFEVQIIINVARTIAAMEGVSHIDTVHIAEAIQYRSVREVFQKEEQKD